jgi:hypothetical protein
VQAGTENVKRSVFTVVDLAGSERVAKTGTHVGISKRATCNWSAYCFHNLCITVVQGVRLDEAKRINKSVSALGNCIAALAGAVGFGSCGGQQEE